MILFLEEVAVFLKLSALTENFKVKFKDFFNNWTLIYEFLHDANILNYSFVNSLRVVTVFTVWESCRGAPIMFMTFSWNVPTFKMTCWYFLLKLLMILDNVTADWSGNSLSDKQIILNLWSFLISRYHCFYSGLVSFLKINDHRRVEAGRDLWRSSCPTTLYK